jgi:dihydrofolate synthase / folylpolyglutamate synthase
MTRRGVTPPAQPPAWPAALPHGRVRRPSRIEDLPGWLAYAESLHPQVIAMGLDRMETVRAALGLKPAFPMFTVAGTNGKGSACAFIASVLGAAGYCVGLYTSPHLLRLNERVRVAGAPVSDALLGAGYAQVDTARGDVPLTPFEFGTLAAMCVFAEAGLDVAVLEVGLGGRRDAVNVFDADCALLTGVGIDHVEYLGHTREAIGAEKAGVFRTGRPAVCADPDPPASVAQEAQRIGARLLQFGRDFRLSRHGDRWTLHRPSGDRRGLPLPALAGEVQLRNAAAALVAIDAMAGVLPVGGDDVSRGLAQARLSGRFQRWRAGPEAPEVVLDVSHNPQAAQELAATLAQQPVSGRCLAVFAMLRDKDILGAARSLAPQVDGWFIGGITERRGASTDELAAELDAAHARGPVMRCADPAAALAAALGEAGAADRVLVTGSFSTVAAAMRQLVPLGLPLY